MNDLALLIIGVMFGIGASAVTFRIPPREVIWATLAGFLGWEVSCCLGYYEVSTLIATTLGALTVQLAAEVLARDRKKPASIYVVPGIIPLVPGRATYNMMTNLLDGNYVAAVDVGAPAIMGAGGIAIGMLMGSSIAKTWHAPVHKPLQHPQAKAPELLQGFMAIQHHVDESVRQHLKEQRLAQRAQESAYPEFTPSFEGRIPLYVHFNADEEEVAELAAGIKPTESEQESKDANVATSLPQSVNAQALQDAKLQDAKVVASPPQNVNAQALQDANSATPTAPNINAQSDSDAEHSAPHNEHHDVEHSAPHNEHHDAEHSAPHNEHHNAERSNHHRPSPSRASAKATAIHSGASCAHSGANCAHASADSSHSDANCAHASADYAHAKATTSRTSAGIKRHPDPATRRPDPTSTRRSPRWARRQHKISRHK